MASTSVHPRRRPARAIDSVVTPSLIDCFQNMSLRKGDTYHPTSGIGKNDFWDPLEAKTGLPAAPLRSTTSPKALEDLLIGAGERRVAQLLNRVDRAVAAKSKVALGNVLSEPDVLPVPSFMVNNISIREPLQKPRARHHSHSSDSGIGSSIAGSTESNSTGTPSTRTATLTSPSSAQNQSFSSISASDEERGLSKYAAEQINRYIIKPILREESLKEFHNLIESVPSRIGGKEIKTLRDLEKTLIFLAPDYSRSPSKYLAFCERTIRVLHTTVTTLHESDQRAPADRPYTQGYFFDLVEQIRRYAAILAATREKQAKGDELDEMDYTLDEKVSIHGGISHNGRPAELVRHTADGKVISIATGQPISEEDLASASMKRPSHALDGDDDDDDVLRSMARRKKNAKPEIHTCELCSKEFKRPCDLTKHVKTHERPWKCPREDCKYHAHGWPTEKERDRHVNDKHSNTPALYHCLYKPCPYTSKRESNCKQHMEKAHGWNYIRSKSNGKGRAIPVTRLHQGSVPPSPSSAMLTPLTPIAPSPSDQSWSESSRRGSMPPPPTSGPSNYGTPAFTAPSPDFAGHFNMNFDFNDMSGFPTSGYPITPAMSEERRDSTTLSSHSGLQFDGSSFDDASPQDLTFDNFNFGDFNYNQYTPSSVAGPSTAAAPHASPGAQIEQTFTTPPLYDAMNLDEGYAGPNEDFTLFGASASGATSGGDMFPSLGEENWVGMNSNLGSHFDMSNQLPLPTSNSTLDELFPELKNH